MCDFGCGEDERRELQAYKEEDFPLLLERLKRMKYNSLLNSLALFCHEGKILYVFSCITTSFFSNNSLTHI
ncbi:hypothetical protein CDL12_07833 [Handroanthus impetiginosus]|uniref:Uncharacterized protein n=1 Tax=Handroanthus impetiginosus TaxID=429701 RepID=A0A2G9HPP4_9LAMI|nr:hypothetical protein CDL12_07833 [Handroanthus impetiginosus]